VLACGVCAVGVGEAVVIAFAYRALIREKRLPETLALGADKCILLTEDKFREERTHHGQHDGHRGA
jgi:hypothetical protein